jgi:hypothetical protein
MISTEVKDRVIELWDGSAIYVTRQQEEALYLQQVIDAGGIRIDGDFISLKAIKKTGDAYEHAAKIGDISSNVNYRDFSKPFSPTRTKRVDALKGMIKGLKQYIESNPEKCENAKALLGQMNARLDEANLLSQE